MLHVDYGNKKNIKLEISYEYKIKIFRVAHD